MKGVEVSSVDFWFNWLRYYFFGVRVVEDIILVLLWFFNFDVDSKEDENLFEEDIMMRRVFKFE